MIRIVRLSFSDEYEKKEEIDYGTRDTDKIKLFIEISC